MRWSLFVALLIVSGRAQASFFPGDGPGIPPTNASVGLLDHDKAAATLQSFEELMAPAVLQRGGRLHLVLEPENPKVNAQATREGKEWNIIVYGGLLRHPDLGEAELDLILGHELGHHLGGTPTAARDGWSACEGQADYWSTLACFQKLRPHDDGTLVALQLTQLYASMGHGATPGLDRREELPAPRTFYGYPTPQCRLDTLVAGLSGQPRPACWFGPPTTMRR